ncbi:MAG: tRNA (adenosine(37)-N6)-dimethylallyltransferase MiaA [Cytophagaceae bacterium]|nr:tRNA (adenosine(37)-N6)-dimethylallyltransferase MiaA [Cytophagaceae bacterium]|tara:strand:+ start:8478 stop:9386 length:909 start_codon:yes stop_codon:yes gene_type:complete
MPKTLITVVGPTAIGKTALSIKLAQHYNTEIVSADSRQFFKEMKIGTAVPDEDELAAARHHFIQHISIQDDYNVGIFEQEAIHKLDKLFKEHATVILVGGSGLYVNAVLYGLDDFPEVKAGVREELSRKLENEGLEPLRQMLKNLDPEHYKRVDLDNPQRVVRALEVCVSSGMPYSSFLAKNMVKRDFDFVQVGLTAKRELIYDRINRRVDLMMQHGLEAEAKKLYSQRNLNALQTVGYRELFAYFDHKISRAEAIEEIKKNTRRFAKRQLTWYRKDDSIHWFDHQCPVDEIVDVIDKNASP